MAAETGESGGNAGAGTEVSLPWGRRLSTKLLALTVVSVLIAEVLIFIPSVANFRLRWLEEQLSTAATASVVLMDGDASTLPRNVQNEVLMALGAKAVAVRSDGDRA